VIFSLIINPVFYYIFHLMMQFFRQWFNVVEGWASQLADFIWMNMREGIIAITEFGGQG